MLRHVAESTTEQFRLFIPDIDSTDRHSATMRFDQPIERAEQCRLARTTLANERGYGAGGDAQRNIVECAMAVVRVNE